MTYRNRHLSIIVLISAFCLAGALLWGSGTSAQNASVTLTVNGSTDAGVVNGSSVLLEWYAIGVTDCSINNGIGPIPDDELPSGSRTVTPPANAEVTYVMSCVGGSGSASVALYPVITLSANPLSPVASPLTGEATTTISWTTQYATECDTLRWVDASGDTGRANFDDDTAPNLYQTSGSVSFTGWPNYPFAEDRTFTLNCTNVVTGLSTTSAPLLVVVEDAPPPPSPVVEILSPAPSPFTAQQDPNLGIAYVYWEQRAENVSSCTFAAYEESTGNEYNLSQFTDRWSGTLDGDWWLRIATSTRLEVTCKRATDGATTSDSVVVEFEETGLTLPAPTVTLTADPMTVVGDPITGTAQFKLTRENHNVDLCDYQYAFKPDGTSYQYFNYRLTNGNTKSSLYPYIATTTRYVASCVRTYDGARATGTVTVTYVAPEPAPAPSVDVSAAPTEVSVADGFADVTVSWTSQNTQTCEVREATTPGGNSYVFSSSNAPADTASVSISTTTTFTVECSRAADGLSASDSFTVTATGGTGTTTLDSGVTVGSGECLDPDSGVALNPIPDGYMQNPDGSGYCMLIPPPSTVTLDLYQNGAIASGSLPYGVLGTDALELDWDSTDAHTCTAVSGSGFATGDAPDGQDQIAPSSSYATEQYSVWCSGYGGDSTAALSVSIVKPTLTATPELVRVGETTTLGWNVSGYDVANCQIAGPGLGSVQPTTMIGSTTLSIKSNSRYTLTCGAAEASVFIKVLPHLIET